MSDPSRESSNDLATSTSRLLEVTDDTPRCRRDLLRMAGPEVSPEDWGPSIQALVDQGLAQASGLIRSKCRRVRRQIDPITKDQCRAQEPTGLVGQGPDNGASDAEAYVHSVNGLAPPELLGSTGPSMVEAGDRKNTADHSSREPMEGAGWDAKGPSHAELRSSIAEWFRGISPGMGDCAEELALAVHPWPDEPLGESEREALVAELLPRGNLPHPDVRQVAADRLLRFAEVLHAQTASPISRTAIESAANRLINQTGAEWPTATETIQMAVCDPMGMETVNHCSPKVAKEVVDGKGGAATHDAAVSTVTTLLRSALVTGSLDLGENLGQARDGSSLIEMVRATSFRELFRKFDDFLDYAGERTRDVLLCRPFAIKKPKTLESLAGRWRVTSERIRQIEETALERVKRDKNLELASAVLQGGRESVFPPERLDSALLIVGSGCRYPTIIRRALVWVSGPWERTSGWVYHSSLAPALARSTQAILAKIDERGILQAEPEIELEDLFATRTCAIEYLESAIGLVNQGGIWTQNNSKHNRIAAALQKIGRPATKREIQEVGEFDPTEFVGSTLSNMPTVVRASKTTWGFEEWVDDVYEGVPAEIRQRIDENNGSVPVAKVMEELPKMFGVSPASVQAYLSTSAFVIVDGVVSHADPGHYSASPPSKWENAVCVNGIWGQRLRLTQHHFTGHSLKVRFDIAHANGLRPDTNLHVPVAQTGELVTLIWRSSDASCSIDVGRVRHALAGKGFGAGDTIVLCPTPDSVHIYRYDEVPLDGASDADPQVDANSESGASPHKPQPDIDELLDDLFGR